jgi:hypothetical protein
LIANARQGQRKWRSVNTVMVHGDSSEVMIFKIKSAPRKGCGLLQYHFSAKEQTGVE